MDEKQWIKLKYHVFGDCYCKQKEFRNKSFYWHNRLFLVRLSSYKTEISIYFEFSEKSFQLNSFPVYSTSNSSSITMCDSIKRSINVNISIGFQINSDTQIGFEYMNQGFKYHTQIRPDYNQLERGEAINKY